MASSMATMASALARPLAQAGAEAAPGGASVKAWARPRSTASQAKPRRPCSTRTRCQVSRPSATEAPKIFVRQVRTFIDSGELYIVFLASAAKVPYSSKTPATSTTERRLPRPWKSIRCFWREAKARSASTSCEASRHKWDFRAKLTDTASDKCRCETGCLLASKTVRMAFKSASLSSLSRSTVLTAFATAHNVGASPAAAASRKDANLWKDKAAEPLLPEPAVGTAAAETSGAAAAVAFAADDAQAVSATCRRRSTSQVSSSTSSASSPGSSLSSSVAANLPALACNNSAAFLRSSSLVFFSLTLRCCFFPGWAPAACAAFSNGTSAVLFAAPSAPDGAGC
mmetsp:Transcript_145359/g.362525  ORF Transcript_145359/g.362525 Transcript_145359/m.362525 type:complete len:342 (-) Transcript_145359:431-1456(-)